MFGYKVVAHRPVAAVEFPSSAVLGEHFFELTGRVDSHTGRYLCVCKLDDIWSLHRASYEARETARIFPYLPDMAYAEAGEGFRDGRCFVLFDMSGEGHPFYEPAFDDLHAWCDSVGLSRRNVGLMSQNRALAEDYGKWFDSATGIRFFNYDWLINSTAQLFAAESETFERVFGFPKETQFPLDARAADKPFLCQNATPRPLRIATLAMLRASGLLDRTHWSLLTQSARKGKFAERDIRGFLRGIDRQEDLMSHGLELLAGPDKKLEQFAISSANELIFSISHKLYQSVLLSIVTESDFTEGHVIRITEKSVKAAAMGSPIIVFGNPHSLRLLRDFGFQTFDPIIDETYDEMFNCADRFRALSEQLVRLDQMFAKDADGFIQKVSEICKFNAAHARSGDFLRQYNASVEAPLWTALREELLREPSSCCV